MWTVPYHELAEHEDTDNEVQILVHAGDEFGNVVGMSKVWGVVNGHWTNGYDFIPNSPVVLHDLIDRDQECESVAHRVFVTRVKRVTGHLDVAVS